MKKLLVVLIVLLPSLVFAAPFFVCDDAGVTTVTEYVIEVDGVEYTTPYPMRMDAAFVGPGDHTARAKAKNMWGESVWTDPLVFNADTPGAPSGFGLSVD